MNILFTDVLVFSLVETTGFTAPTDVLVEGTRIASIGPDARSLAPTGARVVPGHGTRLLMPGLINGHFHSSANHMKGLLPSLPLELFMLYESPSLDVLKPTPREAYLRTMLAALEMLRCGVTSVHDDAFFVPYPEPELIDAVMQAYRDSGIRATVALDQQDLPNSEKLPFMSDGVPPSLREELAAPAPRQAVDLLELYGHLISTWHGAEQGRLSAAVSISAPQRVSENYFGELHQLSRTHNLPLFAHMLETRVQRVLADEQPRFRGRSLVKYTADLGYLGERTNVIHAVWVDGADLDLIAASGAIVAHNPISNLRLGSGVMPYREMLDRGIPVALGSDEAITDDAVNLWSVAKMTGLIHNISHPDPAQWPTAREILTSMFVGGAKAGLKDGMIGQVKVGFEADLLLLDLTSISFTPLNDLLRQLVYCESGTSVLATLVAGQIVYEGGRVTTVDEEAILAEAREYFARRLPALELARTNAELAYPHFHRMTQRAAATDVGMNRWVAK